MTPPIPPSRHPPEIEASSLGRSFGSVWAVRGLSMRIPPGSTTGIVGPNGAGKTTTLRLLLGLIRPTEGEVSYGGRPLRGGPDRLEFRVRAAIERPVFEPRLTGRENLRWLSGIAGGAGDAELDPVLDLVGLEAARNRAVGTYSSGMLQRLSLAWCLSGSPELIVLDEPSSELDPEFRRVLRQTLGAFARSGDVTIVISSHLLKELEEFVTHVVLIHSGHVIRQGTVGELLDPGPLARMRIVLGPPGRLPEILGSFPGAEEKGGLAHVRVQMERDRVPQLVATFVKDGLFVHEVVEEKRNLEDFYVEMLRELKGTPRA